MSAKLYKLPRNIPLKVKYAVFGYIRNYNKNNNNNKSNIPKEIINIILIFYFIKFKFKSTDKHDDELLFVDENTVERVGTDNWKCSICTFGYMINIKDCNEFDIYIKWKKMC